MIKVANLYKAYQNGDHYVPVLKKLSLEITRGECVSIMGPSGSGKTTLLNILGCLDTPDQGDYWLDQQLVSKMDQSYLAKIRNQQLGFIFQNFNLIPQYNALQNVELPLIYAQLTAAKRKTIAQGHLASVGLGLRLDHLPNMLSGGERQRVAIARALVNQPNVIFADEPTGNLDSETGKDVMRFLLDLNRQGKTLIFVTHDQAIAQQTQRIIKLNDGQIDNA